MTADANPLRRLAPCMSPWQCVPNPQNSSIATLNRILQPLPRCLHCPRLNGCHHQRRKNNSKKNSTATRAPFNIHNPSQDHRDRG